MDTNKREELSRVCTYVLHTVGECADTDWVIRNIADGHSEALYSLAMRAMLAEQCLADAEDDMREMERQIRRDRQQANVGVDVYERLNLVGNDATHIGSGQGTHSRQLQRQEMEWIE